VSGRWRIVEGEAGPLRVYETTASPGGSSSSVLVLCHELPREPDRATDAGRGYPALADRLSEECASRVIVPMLRGTSGSAGDFSASGWLNDLAAVADADGELEAGLWLIGFGFGGAIALRTAQRDTRVAGVASVAGPADLTAWVSNRERVLERCRRSGVISTAGFPADLDAWATEIVSLAPLEAATHLGRRPLLVVHGSDDAEVPVAAARAIADAATDGPVDLRIVPAAGHWLRADPRVVATLVGWIERHR
jgi:pimeloyl-ACP methyl ester carboxylesterase